MQGGVAKDTQPALALLPHLARKDTVDPLGATEEEAGGRPEE